MFMSLSLSVNKEWSWLHRLKPYANFGDKSIKFWLSELKVIVSDQNFAALIVQAGCKPNGKKADTPNFG